jgi:hypothetical protein
MLHHLHHSDTNIYLLIWHRLLHNYHYYSLFEVVAEVVVMIELKLLFLPQNIVNLPVIQPINRSRGPRPLNQPIEWAPIQQINPVSFYFLYFFSEQKLNSMFSLLFLFISLAHLLLICLFILKW